MKDNIKMIRNRVMEFSLGLQVIFIKAITMKIQEMVMDKCIGAMAVYIKAAG